MFARTVDRAFARFRSTGDSRALALVFDRTAPELLALGRHLASGEAAAEDLVQATFLTAIEDQDSHDGARPVLPWLIGILANHAREARRRGRRELDPERLGKEQPVDPVREAEGRELDTELAGAMARLPEHYRPVLRLFLWHCFEPAEIAATLERPDGTVRAQLHRGLDRLRKLLPAGLIAAPSGACASGRGLQAVRAAVLLHCGAESTALPTAVTVGALAMLLHKKVVLAAAALVLCGSLGYALFAVPAPASSRETAAGPAVTAMVDAQSTHVAGQVTAQALPRVEQPAPPQPITGAIHVQVERERDHVRLGGVGLAVIPKDEAEHSQLTTFHEFTLSDAEGQATFTELVPGAYVIDIDRQGFAHEADEPTVVVAGRTAERVVTVQSGMRVEGSVVDADGLPVEGAAICLHASRLGSVTVAHSDRAGRFGCDGLTAGVDLQARLRGHAPSLAVPVPSVREGAVEVRLQLGAAGCVIAGRVRAESGAPIPGALVAVYPELPPEQAYFDSSQPHGRAVFVRTDGAGTFRCDEVASGPTLVTACARGGLAPGTIAVTAGAAPVQVELTLVPGAIVEGTVSDADRPAAGVMVFSFLRVAESKPSYLCDLLSYQTARTDAAGNYRIAGLMPGQLQVMAQRSNHDDIAQCTLTLAAGETVHCDLVGTPGPVFIVRIEPARAPGESGRWFVMLRRLAEDGTGSFEGRQTDAEGRARFPARPAERGELAIYCGAAAGDQIVAVRREITAQTGEVRIEVPAERRMLQSVLGRLVDATLAPAAGTMLVMTAIDGETVHVQRTTGTDGRFEFAGIPAGRYQLTAKGGDVPDRPVSIVVVGGGREENLGDVRLTK
jgi:RNA polymerase sigma-70 factor (ECF subfamily)